MRSKDTELREERDHALYLTYLRGLREEHFNNMHEAADWCRCQPAPKFYLSAKSLVNYIKMIDKGRSLHRLHSTTRRKVYRLYNLYMKYMEEHPDTTEPKEWICETLVCLPAPEFYMGHDLTLLTLQRERQK